MRNKLTSREQVGRELSKLYARQAREQMQLNMQHMAEVLTVARRSPTHAAMATNAADQLRMEYRFAEVSERFHLDLVAARNQDDIHAAVVAHEIAVEALMDEAVEFRQRTGQPPMPDALAMS